MKRFVFGILVLVVTLCCMSLMTWAIEGKETTKRYTVLVLDTSSTSSFLGSNGREIYRADTAIDYVKKASSRFLENISIASGDNFVAIVSYKDFATVVSDFTEDFTLLKNKIDNLGATSTTRSISLGLAYANELLQNVEEDAIKNVVLFTTGMTNAGDYSYAGQYDENTVGSIWRRTDTQVKLYAYANSAYEQAELLKEKDIWLYTIGLFQTMEKMPDE